MLNLIKSLSIKNRFVIIFISIIAFVGFVSYKFAARNLDDRIFAVDEIKVNEVYPTLYELLRISYKKQSDLMSATIKNSGSVDNSYLNEMDTKIAKIDNIANTIENDSITQAVKKFKSYWEGFKSSVVTASLQDQINLNEQLTTRITRLMESIADNSNLSLDPETYTYVMMKFFSYDVPNTVEHLSKLRANSAKANENNSSNIYSALLIDNFAALPADVGLLDSRLAKVASVKTLIDNIKIENLIQLFKTPPLTAETISASNATFDELMNVYEKSFESFGNGLDERVNGIDRDLTLTFILISVILTGILALLFLTYKSIINSLTSCIKTSDAIANGNLSIKIITGKDEFDNLTTSLQKMCNKLQEVIHKFQQSTNSVVRGSEEISQGNLDLSQRTEKQASSLASTAASMEEVSVTVKDNAKQSQRVSELAETSSQQAEDSGKIVKEAINAMNKINHDSKKIAEIISVIDSIAFQTNLLALNASVEAARAGDQGRGFAVVASEVRNLSQRCAKAAREINELINTIVTSISEGTVQVNKSGESLDSIVNSIHQVSEFAKSIAAATKEQSVGLEEINKAITQMDGITQQNAALVEETAAASANVSKEAQELSSITRFFTIEGAENKHDDVEKIMNKIATKKTTSKKIEKRSAVAASNTTAPRFEVETTAGSDDDWKEF